MHVSSGTLRRCTQGTLCEYSEYPTHVGAGTLLLVGMDDFMDSGEIRPPILYEYAAPNPAGSHLASEGHSARSHLAVPTQGHPHPPVRT